ncbi:MAG: beta-mannanase [Ruminococcaceae bacterium]|nr:beta-mannanase [Oscillospiraceae bacterium]
MKKLLSALLAAAMVISLAGCSGSTSSTADSTDASTSASEGTDSGAVEEVKLSEPVKVNEDGSIDMDVALAYETDIDALIASFNEKEVDPTKPVSENSNAATLEVFDYLRSIYGKQMLFCQQQMDAKALEDIVYYNATGDLPAMKGFDFIFSTGSYINNYMVDEAIKWHEASGGLVTFTWHWNVPRDIDSVDMGAAFYQEEIVNWNQVNAVTPGTKEYEQVIKDIDTIVIQLQRLEAAGVTVLFRPLHEASGSWFWWGIQDRASVNEQVFQKLWYMIYDRIENYHKLTNIIWIWNGQTKNCAVHPNSYDIAGIDYYAQEENHSACESQYNQLSGYNESCYQKYYGEDFVLEEEPYSGKMLAMTECGYMLDPADCTDKDCMWLYYMIWNGDFVYEASESGAAITDFDGTPSPNPKRMTNELINEYFGNEVLITYRDLPSKYIEGKDIPQQIKNWEFFKTE